VDGQAERPMSEYEQAAKPRRAPRFLPTADLSHR